MNARGREFDVNAWLSKAQEDELTCRSLLRHRDGASGVVCFHAQQMAEKFLKALLIAKTEEYPRIHDLKRLATLLEPSVPDIFTLDEEFNVLNKFYPTTRYPGDFPEGFTWKDAEAAYAAAERIKKFVNGRLKTIEV